MWNKELLQMALKQDLELKCDKAVIDFDSRNIKEGDIFIALPGTNGDGADFVRDAYARGAAYIIVTDAVAAIPENRQIIVPDTYEFLLSLARFKRQQYQGNIIAITGSLGKTTAKDFCHYLFSQKYKSYASFKNFNNHIGVPLCLANLDLDTEYAFFELGMNHLGEIRFLTKLLEPNLAVITTITNAHIGNFVGISGIIEAKSEIVEGLRDGGKLIINAHGGHFQELYQHLTTKQQFPEANIVLLRTQDEDDLLQDYQHLAAPLCLIDCDYHRDFQLTINFKDKSERQQIKVPVFKSNIALTFILPFLLLEILGEDYADLLGKTQDYQISNGRGTVATLAYHGKKIWLVDESYNSSPDAVRALLADISFYQKQYGYKLIFFMGDMLELGEQSEELHLSLKDDIIRAGTTKFIAIGAEILPLYQEMQKSLMQSFYYAETKDLLENLQEFVEDNSIVIVKGSRGIKTDLIVNHLVHKKNDA